MDGIVTTGDLSRELGVSYYRVRRAAAKLPGIPRVAGFRVIPRSRVPEIVALLGGVP